MVSTFSSPAFSLASESSVSDSTVVIEGSKHVKDVKVFTNNGGKYISINFNDVGKEKYKEICTTKTSIYLKLGEYSQSIDLSGVSDYSSFTLSNNPVHDVAILIVTPAGINKIMTVTTKDNN